MDFKSNCKKCPKNTHCCIFKNSGFVFVGIKDAKKIRKQIKKEYCFFLDYSPISKKIVNCLKQDDPALEGRLRYSQLDKNNRILRLKTKKDGRCIFLNKQNRCDIYSIRPNICRIFPFWAIKLINGKIKIIPHDVQPKCKVMRLLITKQKDIDAVLSRKEKNEIKKTVRKIKDEHIFYRKNIMKFIKSIT
jgi:Fe-S-cluster containining protein